MQTKDRPFHLEQFVPGAFLIQGLAGGAIVGFTFMFVVVLWSIRPNPLSYLLATPTVMVAGSIAGVILATLIWTVYRVIGIQMLVGARVILTVITIRLITMFLGLRWSVDRPSDFILGIGIALFAGLPLALLVGSTVRPWQLFTFGSIKVGPSTFERTAVSQSIFGTLGTLPLRFLSIAAFAVWVLYVSCQREMNGGLMGASAALLVPAVYPAFSAYVTFRSPHKTVLLFIGLIVNLPVALIAINGLGKTRNLYGNPEWFSEALPNLGWICTAFVIAWTIFLVARLSARPSNPVLALDDMLREIAARPFDRLDQNLTGFTRLDRMT